MVKLDLSRKAILTFVIIFSIYSVLGSVLEHAMYYFNAHSKTKKLANPILTGFPLYGIGAYLVIAVHEAIGHTWNIILQFFVYAALMTLLEYYAGLIVGAGPKYHKKGDPVRTWDYSGDPHNYQGIVKLQNFILFGVLAVAITRIHPWLKEKVGKMFESDPHSKSTDD